MDEKQTAVPTGEAAETKPKKSKGKTAQLEEALREQEDRYMRMLAEYANYKRRTEQEKEQIGGYARAELLKQVLPVLDNFDRAASAPDGPGYRDGVELIVKQMHELLDKLGVTVIDPLGQTFDADIHYAVMREQAGEGVEADTVTAVLQVGYKLGDRLLRPAMVKVAN